MLQKKNSVFGGGKKKSDSEILSYNLMLNSGKKNCALRNKKYKYSNSYVVRKKISERNKKPCKLNGRSIIQIYYFNPCSVFFFKSSNVAYTQNAGFCI